MTAERLKDIPLFAELDDTELSELAASGSERRLTPGEYLFRQGERASAFQIVLEGALETTRDVAGEQVLMMTHRSGSYLGATALLTDTPYRASTFAVADTVLFELPIDGFRRMIAAHPALMREFLSAIESVSGAIKGLERDREKLLAVGKLAAGLAHELNNPAAAAVRGVATLHEHERLRHTAFFEMASSDAGVEQLAGLVSLSLDVMAQDPPAERDPLAESDREAELMADLEQRGIPDAFQIASAMTDARLGPDWVDRVAGAVGEAGLANGLRFVAASAGVRVLIAELEEATTRISDLVNAFRSYSYLDQAPHQTVDVHEGLETTLTLLGHQMRAKRIELVREFAPDLPTVEASGSELNQVWTNLIDNAIDAVDEGGRITVLTERLPDRVCVEIGDDGPGIPDEIQKRIFDAFYSTKPVGQGSGLGLDIAQRIVVRHHGEIRLESKPGDTRFQVILPVR